MKTSVIQSLIDRNANKIAYIESCIRFCKDNLKKIGQYNAYDTYKVGTIKDIISKHRQTLKKLVTIQKELKKELAYNIRNESFMVMISNDFPEYLNDAEAN